MSLQLILGGSGQGKTTFLHERITKDAGKNPDKMYLMLVPEQFTMETQKALVLASDRGGILNIDVLSFVRMAHRVLAAEGVRLEGVLDDLGKMLVLKKVLHQCQDSLTYFSANIHKEGYVSEMKSFLSEMMQYDIDENRLKDMCGQAQGRPMLEKKLQDMLVVYQSFREYIEENFIMEEEILDVLAECLETSDYLKNTVVCLDGFTGFTPVQYKLIRQMMELCDKVYVTVTIDEREEILKKPGEFELFALSKKTIQKLYGIARESGTEILDAVYPGEKGKGLYRFRNSSELAFLEQSLFRYPVRAYGDAPRDVVIHQSCKPAAEVHYVAGKIKSLLKQGFGCEDIAVVTGDMSVYGSYIDTIFAKAGFPFFMDRKHDIMSNPFVHLVENLVKIVCYDFNYESMAVFIKSPFTDISREDADVMENYMLAKGIRGKGMWEKTWEGNASERTWKVEAVGRLQTCKEKFLPELLVYAKEMAGVATVREKSRALYHWLQKSGVYTRLMERALACQKEGDAVKFREYTQVYQCVIQVLEQLVSLLGKEKVDNGEYLELLLGGINEARVGFIPASAKDIIVGDMQRTRLSNIKVLFVLGANDGLIPQAVVGGGILSDEDRNVLKECVDLAPTMREQVGLQQFYLYLNLTKPSEKLWITYSKSGEDGKECRPSYLCQKIRSVFPKLEEEYFTEDYESILSVDLGEEYFLRGLRDFSPEKTSPVWRQLLKWYKTDNPLSWDTGQVLTGACAGWKEGVLSEEMARELYGEELQGSISRLECYAQCAFKHFLMYGLRLQEREEDKLDTPDYGSFIHEALEMFGDILSEKNIPWRDVTDEMRAEFVHQVVEEEAKQFRGGMILKSARYAYLAKRMERVLNRTVWAITRQLGKSKYADQVKMEFEVEFATRQDNLELTGIIDRMEIYDIGDEQYIKIVDYKTGQKRFDVRQLYYGLQMQLIAYMDSAMHRVEKNNAESGMEKNIIPAGIFYYNISDPMLDGKVAGEEEAQSSALKQLRMEGVFNRSGIVPELLDKEFDKKGEKSLPPGVKSDVVKMASTSKGEFDRYTQGVPEDMLDIYVSHVRDTMRQMGAEIHEGNIAIKPYMYPEKPEQKGCLYCPYSSICRMDDSRGKEGYRILDKDKEAVEEEFAKQMSRRQEQQK